MDWFNSYNDEFELFEMYPDVLVNLLTDRTSNKCPCTIDSVHGH